MHQLKTNVISTAPGEVVWISSPVLLSSWKSRLNCGIVTTNLAICWGLTEWESVEIVLGSWQLLEKDQQHALFSFNVYVFGIIALYGHWIWSVPGRNFRQHLESEFLDNDLSQVLIGCPPFLLPSALQCEVFIVSQTDNDIYFYMCIV